MSIDSSVINLDKKIVIDNYGGRHIPWLVEKFAGDRLMIDHDCNSGLDGFRDIAVLEEGFLEYSADDFIEYLEGVNIIAENKLIEDSFFDFRYSVMNSCKNLGSEIIYSEVPTNSHIETGIDKELDLPWFRCSSITELCKGLLEYDNKVTELNGDFKGAELLQSFVKTGLNTIDYKTHIFKNAEKHINLNEVNKRDFKDEYDKIQKGDTNILEFTPKKERYVVDYKYQLEALVRGDKVLPLWNEKWEGSE